jgi:hypothetical protein
MRQRYVRLIENGQRLGDGFFEVLQDRFQGNFGGIGEQLVKVVFNFAMRFVPHVVCEITESRLATGQPMWIMGRKPSRGTSNCSTISWSFAVLGYFSRKVALAFPALSQHSTG